MKKKIFGLAAAIMAFVAINASAQSSTSTTTSCPAQAKCQKAEKCSKEQSQCTSPFAGLNLTEAQKQALNNLKKPSCKGDSACKANQAQCKAKKEEYKAAKKQLKSDRAENMKAARKDYLAQVKSILTPEQYQQFLENNFINGTPRHEKHGMKKFDHKGKKGDFKAHKRDCKGNKCQ